MAVLTALFGRLWCGWACPLGLAQDIIARLRKHRPQRCETANRVRFAILTAVLMALLLGSSLPFLVEPNTQLVRFATKAVSLLMRRSVSVSLAALLLPLIWVLLALVRPRFFCRFICPSGAVLSILSLHAPFRVRLTQNRCTECNACGSVCPTGAITNGRVSQSACINCFACIEVCPQGALWFGAVKGRQQVAPITLQQRRRILRTLLVGIAAGLLPSILRRKSPVLRPPTAKNTIPQACIHCFLCVAVCPNGVIVVGADLSPQLDFTAGNCEFRCTACGSVCPTGAINFQNIAQKWRTPVGKARINKEVCFAHNGSGPCMGCYEVCPAEPESAIVGVRTEFGWEAPEVVAERCVGCGTCVFNCPANAITVLP